MNRTKQLREQQASSHTHRELQHMRTAEAKHRIEVLEEERMLRDDIAEAWDAQPTRRTIGGKRHHPGLFVDAVPDNGDWH